MPSIRLNKSMREDIVLKLGQQMAKPAAINLKEKVLDAETLFWKCHNARVASHGIASEDYSRLIQVGMLIPAGDVLPKIPNLNRLSEGVDGHDEDWVYPTDMTIGEMPSKVLMDIGIMGPHGIFTSRFGAKIRFYRNGVPRLNDMDKVDNQTLIDGLRACAERFENLARDLNEFLSDAGDVLAGCSTSKQVEDIFPEAAKLLPVGSTKNYGALVAKEKADRVRAILSQSVGE